MADDLKPNVDTLLDIEQQLRGIARIVDDASSLEDEALADVADAIRRQASRLAREARPIVVTTGDPHAQ